MDFFSPNDALEKATPFENGPIFSIYVRFLGCIQLRTQPGPRAAHLTFAGWFFEAKGKERKTLPGWRQPKKEAGSSSNDQFQVFFAVTLVFQNPPNTVSGCERTP